MDFAELIHRSKTSVFETISLSDGEQIAGLEVNVKSQKM